MIAHTTLPLGISKHLLLIYPSLMLCSIHAPIWLNINVSKEQGQGATELELTTLLRAQADQTPTH